MTRTAHLEQALKKATAQKEALRSIAGAAWGVGLPLMLQLFQSTVLPKLLYGCSVWMPLNRGHGFKGGYQRIISKLTQLQRTAIASATGALRIIAGAALDVEFNVQPMEIRLQKTIYGTANRIKSSPIYKEIQRIRQKAPTNRKNQRWNSPL